MTSFRRPPAAGSSSLSTAPGAFRASGARARLQRGYTLVEMGIIGMFLGLMSVFMIQQISSRVGDTQRAESVYVSSRKLSEWWSMVWQFCGLPPDSLSYTSVGNGALTAAINNMSLATGKVTVAAGYASCYKNTGLRPMPAVFVGATGAQAFMGMPVTWSYVFVNGRHAVMVSYANMSEDVFLPMYRKYSKVTGANSTYSMANSATDTTDVTIRYGARNSSGRTVSVIQPM